jgi:hypothetical protein
MSYPRPGRTTVAFYLNEDSPRGGRAGRGLNQAAVGGFL